MSSWSKIHLHLVPLAFMTLMAWGQAVERPTAHALKFGGFWDVSIVFPSPVDATSASDFRNYSVAQGSIDSVRFVPESHAVVVRTSGVPDNSACSISFHDVLYADLTAVPNETLEFQTSGLSWAGLGGNQLSLRHDAVARGNGAFDLIGSGFTFGGTYDEATFVGETVLGDFDRKVRIMHQDPSSEWARAGLIVRENLDQKPSPQDPTDPAQAFGPFVTVHVNPALQHNGAPANNSFEMSWRRGLGEEAELLFTTNAAPLYPNAWVRLQRENDRFTGYRSEDGTNWIVLATGRINLGNSLWVGLFFTPELSNIPASSGVREPKLAQFQNYGYSFGNPSPPPTLTVDKFEGQVRVIFTGGALQDASAVSGPWRTTSGARTPHMVTPTATPLFFRLKL